MNYAEDVTGLIGNTPLVKLKRVSDSTGALVLGKCEFMNPTSSVKDRIGANMVKDAIESGRIGDEKHRYSPGFGCGGEGYKAHPYDALLHEHGETKTALSPWGGAGTNGACEGYGRSRAKSARTCRRA